MNVLPPLSMFLKWHLWMSPSGSQYHLLVSTCSLVIKDLWGEGGGFSVVAVLNFISTQEVCCVVVRAQKPAGSHLPRSCWTFGCAEAVSWFLFPPTQHSCLRIE